MHTSGGMWKPSRTLYSSTAKAAGDSTDSVKHSAKHWHVNARGSEAAAQGLFSKPPAPAVSNLTLKARNPKGHNVIIMACGRSAA